MGKGRGGGSAAVVVDGDQTLKWRRTGIWRDQGAVGADGEGTAVQAVDLRDSQMSWRTLARVRSDKRSLAGWGGRGMMGGV